MVKQIRIDKSDWLAHAARIREEIKTANEQADSLDHILPTIPDDETKDLACEIKLSAPCKPFERAHQGKHFSD